MRHHLISNWMQRHYPGTFALMPEYLLPIGGEILLRGAYGSPQNATQMDTKQICACLGISVVFVRLLISIYPNLLLVP